MPWRKKQRQQEKQAAVRAAVPHRHDYRKAGTVTRPDGSTHTVWACKGCPSRMED
jgi:hypothetical protein